mgnify:CR=1 FL=1
MPINNFQFSIFNFQFIRVLLVCLCHAVLCASVSAQNSNSRQLYSDAEDNYKAGRIDEALSLLQTSVKDFDGSLQQSAFRLMALCCLANDRMEETKQYTMQLLAVNPYYTPTALDPPRFADIVEDMKKSMTATITTASSQAEGIGESPVPVTLITSEMIENSGARNLQELLAAYVPGMTIVDSNDDMTTAMRGIFTTSQEMMLVLLNGHRLNSYATNSCNLDYSISLEKIKQIEVLRGPSSSLYGGVALTAVVNIITKGGPDVDGVTLHAGAGNHGQLRGDMLFGKAYYDLNILVWASIYQASGQQEYIAAEETGTHRYGGNYYIGRVNGGPSYDIGVTLNWRHFHLLYSSRYSKVAMPLTTGPTFLPYDYDKYASYRGQTMGKGLKAHHAELSYANSLGRLDLSGSISYDNSDLLHHQALSDSSMTSLATVMGMPDEYNQYFDEVKGIFRYHDAQETHLGGFVKCDLTYAGQPGVAGSGSGHHGTLSVGFHLNHFSLDATRYFIGGFYDQVLQEPFNFSNLGPGTENSGDAYVQLKHRWGRWLLNAGARLDFINHYDDEKVRKLSPRATLIYLAPRWNVKFNYSRSFVDAPYFYRKTNYLLHLASQSVGGSTPYVPLMPETLDSYQLNFGSSNLLPGLAFDVNLFYNKATDLIYKDMLIHGNAGMSKIGGMEFSAQYRWKRLFTNLTASLVHTFESDMLSRTHNTQYNVPAFSSQLVAAYKLTSRLNVHGHLSFYGSQDSYKLTYTTMGGNEATLSETEVPARAILNLGASYEWKHLSVGANISNVFNTTYYQGGITLGNMRQQGRWFMADIRLKI